MSVNSKMRAIADAVRSLFKWEDTAMLGLDEMAGYVGFAKQFIDDALVSVKNKGVTVGDNATIADLSSLIDSIPTGGGSGTSVDTCEMELYFTETTVMFSNYVVIGTDGKMQPMSMVQPVDALSQIVENAVSHSYAIFLMYPNCQMMTYGDATEVCSFDDTDGVSIHVIEINGDCMIHTIKQ